MPARWSPSLLASGMQDEAVARQFGVSARTLQRRLQRWLTSSTAAPASRPAIELPNNNSVRLLQDLHHAEVVGGGGAVQQQHARLRRRRGGPRRLDPDIHRGIRANRHGAGRRVLRVTQRVDLVHDGVRQRA